MYGLLKPSIAAPRIELPDSVVLALPGYRLSCPVTGTPPIHTALIRNSTVVVNTTGVIEAIIEEGNYICRATNEYGEDVKDFSVVFIGEASFKQNMHCCVLYVRSQQWRQTITNYFLSKMRSSEFTKLGDEFYTSRISFSNSPNKSRNRTLSV